jgi:hypothetical protein
VQISLKRDVFGPSIAQGERPWCCLGLCRCFWRCFTRVGGWRPTRTATAGGRRPARTSASRARAWHTLARSLCATGGPSERPGRPASEHWGRRPRCETVRDTPARRFCRDGGACGGAGAPWQAGRPVGGGRHFARRTPHPMLQEGASVSAPGRRIADAAAVAKHGLHNCQGNDRSGAAHAGRAALGLNLSGGKTTAERRQARALKSASRRALNLAQTGLSDSPV